MRSDTSHVRWQLTTLVQPRRMRRLSLRTEETVLLIITVRASDNYLTLLDETGRIIRGDMRGAPSASLPPILDRLHSNRHVWMSLMLSGCHVGLGRFGAFASREREAMRRGAKWIIDTPPGSTTMT